MSSAVPMRGFWPLLWHDGENKSAGWALCLPVAQDRREARDAAARAPLAGLRRLAIAVRDVDQATVEQHAIQRRPNSSPLRMPVQMAAAIIGKIVGACSRVCDISLFTSVAAEVIHQARGR